MKKRSLLGSFTKRKRKQRPSAGQRATAGAAQAVASWVSFNKWLAIPLIGLLFILPLVYLFTAFAYLWNHYSDSTLKQEGNNNNLQLRVRRTRPEASVPDDVTTNPKMGTVLRFDEIVLDGRLNSDNEHHRLVDITALPCMPRNVRLPPHIKNVSTYFANPQHAFPHREYLFSYNPSIVPLPLSSFKDTSTSNNNSNNDPNTTPQYIASFRISNKNYCFHPQDRQLMMGMDLSQPPLMPNENIKNKKNMMKPNTKQQGTNGKSNKINQKPVDRDYLGLALLTQDLKIVDSVVVDLREVGFRAGEDFRLFVLHNQLYVTSNDLIAPLWIRTKPAMDDDAVRAAPIVYGDNQTFPVWIGRHPACSGCGRSGICGKNLNYFVDTTDGSTEMARVEMWPSPSHLVHAVNLSHPCHRSNPPPQVFGTSDNPSRSFATIDAHLFPHVPHSDNRGIFTRGRGGACCVQLEHPTTHQPLWVGIQHSKTPSQAGGRRNHFLEQKRLAAAGETPMLQPNHYVSSIYAFETKPPYRLVAQSGYFCLPLETSSSSDALIQATAWRRLQLGNETLEHCPRIHFVTGITRDVGGKNDDVIVSYGVNDCYSRIVRIPRQEILRLLFLDQKDVLEKLIMMM